VSQTREQVEEFARSLNEDVREKASEGIPYPTEAECFAAAVLEMFEEAGVMEESEVCVRGGRLGRAAWEIAGWAFPLSDDEDQSQLAILAILFNDDPSLPPLTADDLRRRFELVLNFVRAMVDGRADDLEPAADAAALGRIIHQRKKQLRRLVVHLATDGLTQRLKEIESEFVGSIEVACSIWDVERLSRLSDPKQEEIDIDVLQMLGGHGLPCLRVPEEDPHYDAYLCVVPGTLLCQAYEQYGQRLLELNVRAFLSATGKVNKGIRETIRTQPERFFPYNNGLALTARHVQLRKNAAGQDEIVRIVGLQIVNGGQTTASIHRAWKLDGSGSEVSRVFVQAKLTVITTEENDDDGFVELVRSISKYANSQNAVKGDDLESNQPWHVAFEKLSRSIWTPDAKSQWYYERSRGSYATSKAKVGTTTARRRDFDHRWPRSQMVAKTDLAKCWNAWAQRPEIVSRGGQKNFKHFMETLDSQVGRPELDEREYKRTIGKVILYRTVTRLVNNQRESIPAYRANVVAYLVAYLSFRMTGNFDFDRVWERQAVPEPIQEVLRSWTVPIYNCVVTTAGARNVTEWCKNPDCWAGVRSLNLPTDVDLATFAAADGPGATLGILNADDATAISECLRLSPEDWERLFQWATKDGNLHWKSRGIIQTLGQYALQNWTRQPSIKQARAAVKAINRWRSNGGHE
jgi:hypothetical protein